jgi:hypothetical protein
VHSTMRLNFSVMASQKISVWFVDAALVTDEYNSSTGGTAGRAIVPRPDPPISVRYRQLLDHCGKRPRRSQPRVCSPNRVEHTYFNPKATYLRKALRRTEVLLTVRLSVASVRKVGPSAREKALWTSVWLNSGKSQINLPNAPPVHWEVDGLSGTIASCSSVLLIFHLINCKTIYRKSCRQNISRCSAPIFFWK